MERLYTQKHPALMQHLSQKKRYINKYSAGKMLTIPENWQAVNERFTAIWIADGSTLEQLRRKLKELRESNKPLGGK